MIRAAKYYEVPPWELAEMPFAWVNMAMVALEAESHAGETTHRRLQRRQV